LLHDNVVRPLSIEVARSLTTARGGDSLAKSPLNVARSPSIELAPEGFDSQAISDGATMAQRLRDDEALTSRPDDPDSPDFERFQAPSNEPTNYSTTLR
jgi:hypothetical protein